MCILLYFFSLLTKNFEWEKNNNKQNKAISESAEIYGRLQRRNKKKLVKKPRFSQHNGQRTEFGKMLKMRVSQPNGWTVWRRIKKNQNKTNTKSSIIVYVGTEKFSSSPNWISFWPYSPKMWISSEHNFAKKTIHKIYCGKAYV